MRNNFYKYFFLVAVIAISLSSCDKVSLDERDEPVIGAKIKFFNATLNSPGINLYANDSKITTVAPTAANVENGITFGGVYPNLEYAVVSPGTFQLKTKIAASSTVDPNLEVSSLSSTLENDKYYTVIAVDSYNTIDKKVNTIIINDELVARDTSKALIRFINLVGNIGNVDLAVSNGATIVSSIPYKGVSAFATAPLPGASVNYVLKFSTPTGIITTSNFPLTFNKGRVYTVFFSGTIGGTTTSTTPRLSLTINR